jgi:hypothetical protein
MRSPDGKKSVNGCSQATKSRSPNPSGYSSRSGRGINTRRLGKVHRTHTRTERLDRLSNAMVQNEQIIDDIAAGGRQERQGVFGSHADAGECGSGPECPRGKRVNLAASESSLGKKWSLLGRQKVFGRGDGSWSVAVPPEQVRRRPRLEEAKQIGCLRSIFSERSRPPRYHGGRRVSEGCPGYTLSFRESLTNGFHIFSQENSMGRAEIGKLIEL